MDEMRERIEDLMHRHGFEEDEAYAYYHLKEAERIFESWYRPLFAEIQVLPRFFALHAFLYRRVLNRDYPEGWGANASDEYEEG